MLTYSAEPTDAMLTMTPMEVHIWNLLHSEGPMDAPGIVRNTRGDYFDIMQTIHSMAHRGLLKPQEEN